MLGFYFVCVMEVSRSIATVSDRSLRVSEVLQLVRRHASAGVKQSLPPMKPKGGEIYIYLCEGSCKSK